MENKIKKRLTRILFQAYNEVPFFNNVINELTQEHIDLNETLWERLPTFNKRTIIDTGWLNFIAMPYLDDEFNLRKGIGERIERTSGTTGNPMQILWNTNDYFSSIMNHWKYRGKNFGITPDSKMCTTVKHLPGNQLYIIKDNKMTFSIKQLDEQTIPRIWEAIGKFEPEWFYIQNSILFVMVYMAKKLQITPPKSLRYIEYIGEPICAYYRREIQKILPVPTSNMYGCVETNGISYECKCGNNHLLTDNVITEIVSENGVPLPEGEKGFVCVTGLHNTAMPMLRYRLNDMASIRSSDCPCGNTAPIIDIHAARMPEFLVLDDETISADFALYSPINGGLQIVEPKEDDIVFNLKMNSLDNYEILICQSNQTSDGLENILRSLFEAYSLPDIQFSVRIVDEFDQSKPAGFLRMR